MDKFLHIDFTRMLTERITLIGRGILVIMILVFSLLVYSCNSYEEQKGGDDPKEYAEVTIFFDAPAVSRSESPTPGHEMDIETVEVLFFKPSGNFEYMVLGKDISNISSDLHQKQFKLTAKTGIYDIMVLANCGEIINESFSGSIIPGTSRGDVENKLAVEFAGKWVDIEGGTSKPLPMWGSIDGVTIDEVNTSIGESNPVKLMRGVARVDILISDEAKESFQLKSVRVYNRNTKGMVIPDAATLDNTKTKVLLPTLPVATGQVQTPLIFEGNEITTADTGCEGLIYLLESDAGSRVGYLDNLCLVIGGIYTNKDNSTQTPNSKMVYYRTDFQVNENGSSSFIPVLRNHLYQITVKSVGGHGTETPDEAYESFPADMDIEIKAWVDGNLADFMLEDQYRFIVDKDSLFFYSEGYAHDLEIFTDYPEGWKILEKPQWIVASPGSSSSPGTLDVSVTAETISTPGLARYGEMLIGAGNLRKKIKIYQSGLPELRLTVTPTTLTFKATPTAAKSITVNTYPVGIARKFQQIGDISWRASGFPQDGLSLTEYSFFPSANTSGKQLVSQVTVYITDADGNTRSENVIIKQLEADIEFSATPFNKYPAKGGNALYFEVESNIDWFVDNVNDPDGCVTLAIKGTQQPTSGAKRLYFTLTPNPLFKERKVTVRFNSSDPDFVVSQMELIQDYNDPYIEISRTSPKVLDLGTLNNSEQKSFEFMVNSGWKFEKETGFDDARVVSALDHQAGSVYPGGDAGNAVKKTITVTPYVYTQSSSPKAAGTVVSTGLTFKTTGHEADHPTVSSDHITIRGTVPGFFEFKGFTPAAGYIFPKEGGTIKVNADTNDEWSAFLSIDGVRVDYPAQDWHNSQIELTVPPYTVFNKERIITLWYSNGQIVSQLAQYVQKGFYLQFDMPGSEPSSPLTIQGIDGYNGRLTVGISGDYPDMDILCYMQRDKNEGYILLDTKAVTAGTTRQTVRFDLPVNESMYSYHYNLYYRIAGETKESMIGTGTQNFGNSLLSNGRYLSTNTIKQISWAEAMSIPLRYNWEYYDGAQGTNDEKTGCRAYYEKEFPNAEWYVPEPEELQEMYDKRIEQGQGGLWWLWSSKTFDDLFSYALFTESRDPDNIVVPLYKTQSMVSVRCVRNP